MPSRLAKIADDVTAMQAHVAQKKLPPSSWRALESLEGRDFLIIPPNRQGPYKRLKRDGLVRNRIHNEPSYYQITGAGQRALEEKRKEGLPPTKKEIRERERMRSEYKSRQRFTAPGESHD